MTLWAILVAAGSGSRFGGPKHTALLEDVPLWERGFSMLMAAGVDGTVVVGDVPGGVAGGPRRRDSVLAGLQALPPGVDSVLVHDAARPLATAELARRVVDRLLAGGVDGVVPTVPVTDAIKEVDAQGRISSVPRDSLHITQTPQGFVTSSLLAAHTAIDGEAADDAELIERWGGTLALVKGDPRNLKVTYAGDLAIARSLLEQQ